MTTRGAGSEDDPEFEWLGLRRKSESCAFALQRVPKWNGCAEMKSGLWKERKHKM